ncbi:hypothetical protein YYU_05020 [Anaplasma phagocytophilum str. HZ2]|nr:hypothetical protein YYU_04845 [Anaplasma phagocytophilum str. HZ2]AGR80869.1 hypothetical protein WSQ_04875 [Anaplasma phagocytophilum str. JM]AGR82123.1 hypothetical protein YYY_04875 [Anaplasma phagocytophilum str. Dog2]AGR79633.1 hypothetical protein YYU_05020 [Anaplasma phagocytophilum str. HZ2]AGR80889.1 hypothetical protein WSQ_05055 [Anaplasma phagocytophilum str. JM]
MLDDSVFYIVRSCAYIGIHNLKDALIYVLYSV